MKVTLVCFRSILVNHEPKVTIAKEGGGYHITAINARGAGFGSVCGQEQALALAMEAVQFARAAGGRVVVDAPDWVKAELQKLGVPEAASI